MWKTGSMLPWNKSACAETESSTTFLFLYTKKRTWEFALIQKDTHSPDCHCSSWNRSYILRCWCLWSSRKPSVLWQKAEARSTPFHVTMSIFIDVWIYVIVVVLFPTISQIISITDYNSVSIRILEKKLWSLSLLKLFGSFKFQGDEILFRGCFILSSNITYGFASYMPHI